jgi:N-glycosylase/DNA lyase
MPEVKYCINEMAKRLPAPDQEIMNGVKWGRCDELFTPAYWKIQYQLHEEIFSYDYYRISDNFIEEVCACLLGGFGIKSEMGVIAFEKLKKKNLLAPKTKHQKILTTLLSPLSHGKMKFHYRFPRQKAKYIYEFLNRPDLGEIPMDNDLQLRKWLLTVNGIGMKTASWVTRNWLGSQNVAILDIHIHRAGLIAGIFNPDSCLQKDYMELEKKYLEFSAALEVNAANLDALIWLQLKVANSVALNILKIKN